MKIFKGEHGCPTCLHPGSSLNRARIYLPGVDAQLRTCKSVLESSESAEVSGKAVDGVKGKSALSIFRPRQSNPCRLYACCSRGSNMLAS